MAGWPTAAAVVKWRAYLERRVLAAGGWLAAHGGKARSAGIIIPAAPRSPWLALLLWTRIW
jgi:hypothetical protein